MLNILDVLREFGFTLNSHNFLKCPFHDDSTPSFKVYPNTQNKYSVGSYCCFSCGVGGDAINLYARLNNISNREAFKHAMSDSLKPSKAHLWRVQQAELFKESMIQKRQELLEAYYESVDLLALLRAKITNLDEIPEIFWDFVAECAEHETRALIAEELNDKELWERCKTWT